MANAPVRGKPAHIILATDFSARCDRAQDRAVQLALQWDASLTAVHALTDMGLTDDTSVRDAYRSAAMRNAEALREEFACIEGLRSSVVVEEGPSDAVLLAAAARESADLIVTGIAGNGPLAQVLVGSTVTALARTSPIPTLVVKKKVLETNQRVVVATDLSAASSLALTVGSRWFSSWRLALFHAFELPYRGLMDDDRTEDEDRQSEIAAEDQVRVFLKEVAGEDAALSFQVIARRGDPVTGLQILTNEADTDLVVAASHGRTGLLHTLIGSVASSILEAVPCDVLIVPSVGGRRGGPGGP
jgi:Universal stress protein UspA and related nucleotide-binding proteins